uniref:Uncharacterized protein n=1 Tax=Anguilla anguilla TaxID=7936 RepID=A0A0E9SK02_ANGAN
MYLQVLRENLEAIKETLANAR